ncbi:MAG: precorrin-2 dehydrogenase/sirohydrochlorin ferrochelatase family protein [Syntrophomonadaceae bacterium]|jgi:precorrin-2 dehydrogenase/sirohydrochlorin ferrochelatase
MAYYPIFINLEGKNCLIIGGGKVAERKAATLLDYKANIRIVSPQVEDTIDKWSQEHRLSWRQGEFQESDLKDIFMAFVATDDQKITESVVQLCRSRGILVNAVDDPPSCDFFVPSILRQQSLVIAISTEGKSPMFAKRLRKELEKIITPAYGELVELLGEQRDFVKKNIHNISERAKLFEEMVYSDALELLKAGEKDKARERIKKCISSWWG